MRQPTLLRAHLGAPDFLIVMITLALRLSVKKIISWWVLWLISAAAALSILLQFFFPPLFADICPACGQLTFDGSKSLVVCGIVGDGSASKKTEQLKSRISAVSEVQIKRNYLFVAAKLKAPKICSQCSLGSWTFGCGDSCSMVFCVGVNSYWARTKSSTD